MNPRILTYDLNKDGKKEVIVVKNISAMGRVLKNMPLFTSSEVYNLEWDGIGLAEVWRTKKISGYVADYQIRDIDNDGQDEIVLALVLSVGPTLKTNSCIVAYKLNSPSQQVPGTGIGIRTILAALRYGRRSLTFHEKWDRKHPLIFKAA